MGSNDFYDDLKWCDGCAAYVRYLMSLEHSYCVDCGAKVRLFNREDWNSFNAELGAARPKGGRPRKERDAESA